MRNKETKAIKIGGDALETILDIAEGSYRTFKGTAEMLIHLGTQKLKELNKGKSKDIIKKTIHLKNIKNQNYED